MSTSTQPGGQLSSEMALVNTLGHDLRSPLTAVRGAATLLLQGLDDIPPDKVLDLLGMIDRRVIEMSDRIEDIIAVCHLDAGDLHVYMERVPVATIVARAVDPERGSHADIAVAPVPPDVNVQADVERSVQVIRALFANAARFAPDLPVELGVETGQSRVAFVVSDHGPGVAPEDRNRVFTRLWHGPEGGPGLGLYLAQGLARAMEGDVMLAERHGGGASFSFSLRRDG